jgi:hypothetical protein
VTIRATLRGMRASLVALLLLAVLAPAARAADPGRWKETGHSPISFTYYQGVTSDDRGRFFFDGIFVGLYRADRTLREQARRDEEIPPDVFAREGYNHMGDLTWDSAEGGRVLLPLECYYPGNPAGANTCGTGSIGVADPDTLAWRYYVKLDPAEIPKAMWAEVSPDGSLLWTSVGNDLLAYSTADITPARAAPAGAPLHSVRRLAGAVPPTGITGATFVGDRLYVAGQDDSLFQVWSIDLTTGARQLEIERTLFGESEGLDTLSALGGVLHWIITPADPQRRPPSYQGNVLLHFAPASATAAPGGGTTKPKLRLRARPRRIVVGRKVRLRVEVTIAGVPAAGARVRAAGHRKRTNARGIARITVRRRHAGTMRVSATRPGARGTSKRLRVIRR